MCLLEKWQHFYNDDRDMQKDVAWEDAPAEYADQIEECMQLLLKKHLKLMMPWLKNF